MTARHKPGRFRLAALAILPLALAACGGGGSDAAPAPTLTITSNVAGVAKSEVTFSFTFSDDVGTSFTVDDVVASAGTKGNFTRISPTQYNLAIAPPPGATGSINLSVAANAFANLSNTPGAAAASATQAYDTQVPTLAMGSSGAGTVVNGPVTLTFDFSEDVGTSFTADDVSVAFSSGTGGVKGTLTRLSGTQASLVVTPPPGAVGTFNVGVTAGAFSDLAGNTSTATYFGAQQYDMR